MKIVLASNSPRRRELLSYFNIRFSVISSDFIEENPDKSPVETVKKFALGKAESVFNNLTDKKSVLVLGADTVVFLDGEILGKPDSEENAKQMLKKLSGKTHEVISGYAIITANEKIVGYDKTLVTFNDLSDKLIFDYIKSGLYKGKAGSYGIQDGFPLVKSYIGSLNNVIGLPTEKVIPYLNFLIGKKTMVY